MSAQHFGLFWKKCREIFKEAKVNILGTKLRPLPGHSSCARPVARPSPAWMQFDYAPSAIKREEKAMWAAT